jgi:hypothetical protein
MPGTSRSAAASSTTTLNAEPLMEASVQLRTKGRDGAAPTPVPFGEIVPALQRGIVDLMTSSKGPVAGHRRQSVGCGPLSKSPCHAVRGDLASVPLAYWERLFAQPVPSPTRRFLRWPSQTSASPGSPLGTTSHPPGRRACKRGPSTSAPKYALSKLRNGASAIQDSGLVGSREQSSGR